MSEELCITLINGIQCGKPAGDVDHYVKDNPDAHGFRPPVTKVRTSEMLTERWVNNWITGKYSPEKCIRMAIAQALEADLPKGLGMHLSHCNSGEYGNYCKYGEKKLCPALTDEWSWFGKALDKAEKAQTNLFILRQQVKSFIDRVHLGD